MLEFLDFPSFAAVKNVDGAGVGSAAAEVVVVVVVVLFAAAAAALKGGADDEIGDAVVIKIACSSDAAAEPRSIAFSYNHRPRPTLEDGAS